MQGHIYTFAPKKREEVWYTILMIACDLIKCPIKSCH